MSNEPARQRVKEQYERWPYPEPIVDLEAWLEHNWQWFDPSHAAQLLWPEGRPGKELEILIAGCGTNQAAVFAVNNPTAHVVGIDVSQAALAHHQALKQRYGLDNLEIRQLPIEDVGQLQQSFDLIVSTGVLHHLDDPDAGLAALAQCLKPMGCIGLMLYARYGRMGVELVQQIVQELGLQADEYGLATIKSCLQHTDQAHPLRGYLRVAGDLKHDTGLVDTFLPKRERSYSVQECLNLVAGAGLAFQNWVFNNPYYPKPSNPNPDPFIKTLRALPIEQQWAVMERLNTRNGCHIFMACQPNRLTAPAGFPHFDLLERIPALRHPFEIRERRLYRNRQLVELHEANQNLISSIDGRRTVAELCQGGDQTAMMNAVRELWRLDVITLIQQSSST